VLAPPANSPGGSLTDPFLPRGPSVPGCTRRRYDRPHRSPSDRTVAIRTKFRRYRRNAEREPGGPKKCIPRRQVSPSTPTSAISSGRCTPNAVNARVGAWRGSVRAASSNNRRIEPDWRDRFWSRHVVGPCARCRSDDRRVGAFFVSRSITKPRPIASARPWGASRDRSGEEGITRHDNVGRSRSREGDR
jgi:hypothetical protein